MENSADTKEIPEEFEKIISEFSFALLEVYPEYNNKELHEDVKSIITKTSTLKNIESLYNYCGSVYPINIFHIMGKNDELFEDNEANTEFLPNIDFKTLWRDESITTTTRETIWKYLQLILFTIVGNISNMDSFGDTAKLFEMIDEDELKDKLQETFENMEKMFEQQNMNNSAEGANADGADANADGAHANADGAHANAEGGFSGVPPNFNIPDVNNIHEHLKGLMGGKLGNLAVEIAEETAQELNLDENDAGSVRDVFTSMMKNPKKLMDIANKIGTKLEDKMKSGELNEKELMKEAADMFNKMKNTPGMGDIENMLRSMGGLGKKAKVNMNAMQQHFDRQSKLETMKTRALKNAEMRREKLREEEERRKLAAQQPHIIDPSLLKELGIEDVEAFTCGDKPERTPRPPREATSGSASKSSAAKKKKKKGKK